MTLVADTLPNRPWQGSNPPAVVFVYAPDRKVDRPLDHLKGFAGTLQVDGYAGYRALAEKGEVKLGLAPGKWRALLTERGAFHGQAASPVRQGIRS